jgi:hypothetical protein
MSTIINLIWYIADIAKSCKEDTKSLLPVNLLITMKALRVKSPFPLFTELGMNSPVSIFGLDLIN